MTAEPIEQSRDGQGRTLLAVELAERGLSARALARAAGVHENSVYAWAAGKATPQPDKAARIAAALQVPADQVFPGVLPPGYTPPVVVESGATRELPPLQTVGLGSDRGKVADWLSTALADRQLSAAQLADELGIDRSAVRHWLNGRGQPSPQAAAQLAGILDVPADYIRTPLGDTPLATALTERGLSAAQLARRAGVDKHTIGRWAAGRTTPQADTAARVAAALDVPVNQLLPAPPQDTHAAAEIAPADVPRPAEVLARPATGDPDWRDDASCAKPDQNPDRWWPAPDDPATEARQICSSCPVLGDCRDAYLATPDRPDDRVAIWAGLPGGQLREAARTAAARDAADDLAATREPALLPTRPAQRTAAVQDGTGWAVAM